VIPSLEDILKLKSPSEIQSLTTQNTPKSKVNNIVILTPDLVDIILENESISKEDLLIEIVKKIIDWEGEDSNVLQKVINENAANKADQ